jgi:hypothetical protein
MTVRDKYTTAGNYDVFNGDADGICSLHQLRLADPVSPSILVSGVKRDIALLARIKDVTDSTVTALDISMNTNAAALAQILQSNNQVTYIDHHFAGDIPVSPLLTAYIDTAADSCTSLIVDELLAGKYRPWAVCGAFGDNLHAPASKAARTLSLSESDTLKLREIGELLNYNGYGAQLEDLHFPPDLLYQAVKNYESPLAFHEDSDALKTLKKGFDADMARALSLVPFTQNGDNRIYRFPEEAWARRVSGVFANLKARENPSGAHAMLTENSDGTLRISVRAPLGNKRSADVLCRFFPTGGGRAAAAGINELPADMLDRFIDQFNAIYG